MLVRVLSLSLSRRNPQFVAMFRNFFFLFLYRLEWDLSSAMEMGSVVVFELVVGFGF